MFSPDEQEKLKFFIILADKFHAQLGWKWKSFITSSLDFKKYPQVYIWMSDHKVPLYSGPFLCGMAKLN